MRIFPLLVPDPFFRYSEVMQVKQSQFAARVVISGLPAPLIYDLGPEFYAADVGYALSVEVGHQERQGWLVEKIPFDLAVEELKAQETKKQSNSKNAEQNGGSQLAFFDNNSQDFTEPRIKTVRQATPAFQADQLRLFEWMSEYYGAPLADVIENAVPRKSSSKKITCALRKEELSRDDEFAAEFFSSLRKRAPVQAQVLDEILRANGPVPLPALVAISSGWRSALDALVRKNLVELTKLDPCDLPNSLDEFLSKEESVFTSERPDQLTASQKDALGEIVEAINRKEFSPFLLFGVTGSGKTEVYLRAIELTLQQGGSALVVVPEIALTPQFVDQFRARLQVPLALLHSQVGTTARWSAWEALLRGDIRVAIGARSAVFAPLTRLSLIIVDEEHETSYKQSEGFRYHARDVAVVRGKFAQATVILGSATPSFESLVNVQRRRYRLLELPERATTRPVPQIEIVNLRDVKRRDMPSENISPQLHQAIDETLSEGGQTVILYNRRGFASYLQCESCNEVVSCPNCSVPLTFHKTRNKLLCHYCNLVQIPPPYCPLCRNPETSRIEVDDTGQPLAKPSATEKIGALIHRGSGTEKVVDELGVLFPEASILRMDRDTVGKKSAYREILGSMRQGKSDILVGTQMIAKGHDLPGVTLVGIINADVGLHLPDFRSSEKAYQLITQAAGRSGRGEDPGRVLVQTREADHPTIVATVTGRFRAFARFELAYRKNLDYPPLGRLLRLIMSSTDRQEAYEGTFLVHATLRHLAQQHQKKTNGETNRKLSILGPAPCPHEKLRGRYRWHILVKSSSAKLISQLAHDLNSWKAELKQYKDFRLAVDVDPIDML